MSRLGLFLFALGRSRQSSPSGPNKAIAPSWSSRRFSRSTQASSKGVSARLAVTAQGTAYARHMRNNTPSPVSPEEFPQATAIAEKSLREGLPFKPFRSSCAEQSSTHLRQAIYCYRNCAQIVHGQNQLKPEFRCKCQAIGGVWKSLEGVRPGNSKTTLLLNASILWRFRRTRNPLMIIWKSTAKGSSSQSAR